MATSGERKLIAHALSELHRKSDQPAEAQWFTRAQIGQQLNIASGHLNPARVNALKDLVTRTQVANRVRPDDKRKLPQYQINHDWKP